jgi:hypothetical protein
MKKAIKYLLIIGCVLVLIKLYLPPKWNWELPESVGASKRAGAFLWEYKINIDIIDSTCVYRNVFKEIWVTKLCDIKRNKLGMIHLEANSSQKKYFVMKLRNEDALLNMDNYILRKWTVLDSCGISVGKHWNVLCLGLSEKKGFEHVYTDTLYYTVYRNKISDSNISENLLPLFKMTLIPE